MELRGGDVLWRFRAIVHVFGIGCVDEFMRMGFTMLTYKVNSIEKPNLFQKAVLTMKFRLTLASSSLI